MARNKSLSIKKRLGSFEKKNRPLPVWFSLKKKTKIRYNTKRRNWRRKKLGL